MNIEYLNCLKRERDIRIKPKLRGGKTAFRYVTTSLADLSIYANLYQKGLRGWLNSF